MGQHNRYGNGRPPEPVMPGTIVGVDGDVLAQPGEFDFAEGGPHHDETVYVLYETIQPQPQNRKIGETFVIHLPVPPGWMFCTGKIEGEGNPNDCMLVFLRGSAPPPKGTRFAMRMLRPEDQERTVEPADLVKNPEAKAVLDPAYDGESDSEFDGEEGG